APRLVYADWLEERGDPESTARAAFIRAQCELARLSPKDPRRKRLDRHAQAAYRSVQNKLPGPEYKRFWARLPRGASLPARGSLVGITWSRRTSGADWGRSDWSS